MTDDNENRGRPAAFKIVDCEDVYLGDNQVHGDIDGAHISGGKNITVRRLTKTGPGTALLASTVKGLVVSEIALIQFPNGLERDLHRDVVENNREGFIQKLSKLAKPDQMDAMISLWDRLRSAIENF